MEQKEYAPALPKNSINTPIEHTKEGLVKELHDLRKDNARLRQNNEYYKLEYIAIKEKLFKIEELVKL